MYRTAFSSPKSIQRPIPMSILTRVAFACALGAYALAAVGLWLWYLGLNNSPLALSTVGTLIGNGSVILFSAFFIRRTEIRLKHGTLEGTTGGSP